MFKPIFAVLFILFSTFPVFSGTIMEKDGIAVSIGGAKDQDTFLSLMAVMKKNGWKKVDQGGNNVYGDIIISERKKGLRRVPCVIVNLVFDEDSQLSGIYLFGSGKRDEREGLSSLLKKAVAKK
ncbi:hypothetical protein GF382_02285 [Candidatus Falkowbacteria bacterium]|nr:hypothetical protein [Candidatus Falkowbacteria bacterium]